MRKRTLKYHVIANENQIDFFSIFLFLRWRVHHGGRLGGHVLPRTPDGLRSGGCRYRQLQGRAIRVPLSWVRRGARQHGEQWWRAHVLAHFTSLQSSI